MVWDIRQRTVGVATSTEPALTSAPSYRARMEAAVTETARLILWRWSDHDVEPQARLGTGEVVRYLGGETWTTATARGSIDLWRQIERHVGVTTWAVRLRDSGELIGSCGLAGTNVAWLRFSFVIEIGWTFGRQWWGQGLATEAARAALDVGLARYPADRIISKCHPDNKPSGRVMQRLMRSNSPSLWP